MSSTQSPAVRGLARILHEICTRNSDTPPGKTAFHSMAVPPMTILDYTKRIAKYSACSEEALVCSLIYLVRHSASLQMPLTFFNVHRVLIAAILVAAKSRDDVYFANNFYGRIGGIQARELNTLEVFFLSALQWDLWVDEELYFETQKCVVLDDTLSSSNTANAEAEATEYFVNQVMPRVGNDVFDRRDRQEHVYQKEREFVAKRDSCSPERGDYGPPEGMGTELSTMSPTEAEQWPSAHEIRGNQNGGGGNSPDWRRPGFNGGFGDNSNGNNNSGGFGGRASPETGRGNSAFSRPRNYAANNAATPPETGTPTGELDRSYPGTSSSLYVDPNNIASDSPSAQGTPRMSTKQRFRGSRGNLARTQSSGSFSASGTPAQFSSVHETMNSRGELAPNQVANPFPSKPQQGAAANDHVLSPQRGNVTQSTGFPGAPTNRRDRKPKREAVWDDYYGD